MRWMLNDPITPVVDLARSTPLFPLTSDPTPAGQAAAAAVAGNPDLHDPGANVPDPAAGLIDPAQVAVVGHSMGALSLLNYVGFQSKGPVGADGQPLPPLAAGVSLSGAAPTAATVPIQFQTSDFDGSPTLIGPAVAGVDFGSEGSGIGYEQIKPLYDSLRANGPGTSALSLVVLEGGVHTDFIDTPFLTRTPWALSALRALRHGVARVLPRGVGSACLTAIDAAGAPLDVVRQRDHPPARRRAPPPEPLHHRAHHAVAGRDAGTVRRRPCRGIPRSTASPRCS